MSGWTFFFLGLELSFNRVHKELRNIVCHILCLNQLLQFIYSIELDEFACNCLPSLCMFGGSICKNINLVTGIYIKIYTWASIENVW